MAHDKSPRVAHAQALLRFIDASPSPYHVVENASQQLAEAGFVRTELSEPFSASGSVMYAADGVLLAWRIPEAANATTPLRIIGAHTDSPNLRLKPHPQADAYGYRRLGVEIYGGVLLNSWLDRDLGLSGRLAVRDGDTVRQQLFALDEPLLRIPQLAIHLDREISEKGLLLNRQLHMAPVYGLSAAETNDIWDVIAGALEIQVSDIVGADVMLHDTQPSSLLGTNGEFISAPRIDNQLSCHAAITALSGASSSEAITMVALFDHEEVGSVSASGARTQLMPRILESISEALGGTAQDRANVVDKSLFISADNAHATHPNYPDRHEPGHHIALNEGPVLKHNANQRYTTDAMTQGLFTLAAERAGVATQDFVNRTDMGCGSTIGPTVSALLGMRSLDVGCPQLSMHSCRELAGTSDPWAMTVLLAELLAS